MTPQTKLPTKAGWYWWRPHPAVAWAICELSEGKDGLRVGYSSNQSWESQRWQRVYPEGQWLPVLGPEEMHATALAIAHEVLLYAERRQSDRMNQFAVEEIILAKFEQRNEP